MIPCAWLEEANSRIKAHVVETPLTYDTQRDLYLKWENHQVTGSFKIRGALNKVLSLTDWELERGLVTASAGNHGQGGEEKVPGVRSGDILLRPIVQ